MFINWKMRELNLKIVYYRPRPEREDDDARVHLS